jgi:hypothetical protein
MSGKQRGDILSQNNRMNKNYSKVILQLQLYLNEMIVLFFFSIKNTRRFRAYRRDV